MVSFGSQLAPRTDEAQPPERIAFFAQARGSRAAPIVTPFPKGHLFQMFSCLRLPWQGARFPRRFTITDAAKAILPDPLTRSKKPAKGLETPERSPMVTDNTGSSQPPDQRSAGPDVL
jgi:hypothetical protein